MSVAAAPLALMQTPLFARALHALGLEGGIETLTADGREVGHALVIARGLPLLGGMRAVLRGPVWNSDAPPEARLDGLRGLGRARPSLIETDAPEPVLHRAGYRMIMTPGATGWLDVATAPTDEMPRAHPKWRASLAKARGAQLAIETGPFRGAGADWLLTREAALRRARRYRSVAAPLARALATRAPDTLCLLTARTGEDAPTIIAAMLFVRHGASATYLIGATTQDGRATCAHHLLLARACHQLRQEGVRWLDLGQIDTVANPGLARFKLGTGARLHELGGSWLRLPFADRRLFTGRAGSPMVEALHR